MEMVGKELNKSFIAHAPIGIKITHCSLFNSMVDSDLVQLKHDILFPNNSPAMAPQPLLPLSAPSPLMPFTSIGLPKLSGQVLQLSRLTVDDMRLLDLSGLCPLKFSAAETLLSTTATDCWASLAPYLANVVCCPQFHATLVILIGQSSINTRKLALNVTQAEHCLSDIEQILGGQGANENLHNICSISPSNLTKASCPVEDVSEFERILDTSLLFAACKKIDAVDECCNQVCQNAISNAATKIALKSKSEALVLPEHSSMISDCKNIILRWLASKVEPSSANTVLRGLSSCNMNKVCPLDFPNMSNISKECGNMTSNQIACCGAMDNYMSRLQEQSFITNLQALNCAALLGKKLQNSNVSGNVYSLCHINLKDFSLQDSGCLLPSLPSDVTYDSSSGIGFLCDLNDNVAAPWPSTPFVPASSCNQTTKLPALPKATSAQSGKESLTSEKSIDVLVFKVKIHAMNN
ncbi:hypothetical protein RJ640_011315, partial [Escallonia rubra]